MHHPQTESRRAAATAPAPQSGGHTTGGSTAPRYGSELRSTTQPWETTSLTYGAAPLSGDRRGCALRRYRYAPCGGAAGQCAQHVQRGRVLSYGGRIGAGETLSVRDYRLPAQARDQ